MRIFLVLSLFVMVFTPCFAESELNAKGECDVVAIRRFCDNSPFQEFNIKDYLTEQYYINLTLCRDFSKTYTFAPQEGITAEKLNVYCKGVY